MTSTKIIRDDSMRVAIRVGGFNGEMQRANLFVARVTTFIAAWVTDWVTAHMPKHVAKHLTRRSHVIVKTESSTLLSACRYSQNAAKTPVDAGVLISPRVNIISRALQNASQSFTRFIANKNPVARK
jgi:hypothetical protein